jgi:hypothetical protein
MIFLNAMFGYLVVLIVLKWATASSADLYHILIYMFLQAREPPRPQSGRRCGSGVWG